MTPKVDLLWISWIFICLSFFTYMKFFPNCRIISSIPSQSSYLSCSLSYLPRLHLFQSEYNLTFPGYAEQNESKSRIKFFWTNFHRIFAQTKLIYTLSAVTAASVHCSVLRARHQADGRKTSEPKTRTQFWLFMTEKHIPKGWNSGLFFWLGSTALITFCCMFFFLVKMIFINYFK